MTVPPKYRNRLCGLCGNFNGDISDDFNGRHGRLYETGMKFGNSWRVGGYKACSIKPQDMSRSFEPRHNCSQSWDSRIESDRYCNAIHSTMFEKCARKIKTVKPEYYFNACKLDMCECPTDQCHCEVLTAYARECENLGLLVQGWREATNCVNVTSYRYGKRRNRKNGLLKPDIGKSSINDVLRPSENGPEQENSWLSSNTEPNDIGQVLPAYSPKQSMEYSPKRRFIDQALDYKHLLTPKERRRIRNKERRRRQKQLKRERKRRRRLDRKRRRHRRKRLEKEAQRQKKKEMRDSEIKRLGDEVGLDVVESKDKNGDTKRRLNWSKFLQSKKTSERTRSRPPFEELLSGSFMGSSRSTNGGTSLDEGNQEEEDYQEYDNLLDYESAIVQEGFIPNNANSSAFDSPNIPGVSKNKHSYTKYDKDLIDIPISRRGNKLSSRTPLPLLDMEDISYKRRAKSKRHSRSTKNSYIFYYPPNINNLSANSYGGTKDKRIFNGTNV